MPVGSLKNTLYAMALPFFGKRGEWKTSGDAALDRVLRRHHVINGVVQRFDHGQCTERYAVGTAEDTVFRTASVAKLVTALLVFRLQTKGELWVEEDVSDLLGYPVRNPHHPDVPITLGMVLSHTASVTDSPAYFASFSQPAALRQLLKEEAAFLPDRPGKRFRYSNMAAGAVGCMLENRFGISLEALAQKELFQPLGVEATFDMSKLKEKNVAPSWRVLPSGLAFDAKARIASAKPVAEPDAQHHYLLASGSLFLSASDLAKLTLCAWNGSHGFLNEESLKMLHTPILGWPDQTVHMHHGMGLFRLEDPTICPQTLWGHQGFAYGAVNGVFFDEEGSGFVCLNGGASERRIGHLACLNRDLISLWMKEHA